MCGRAIIVFLEKGGLLYAFFIDPPRRSHVLPRETNDRSFFFIVFFIYMYRYHDSSTGIDRCIHTLYMLRGSKDNTHRRKIKSSTR